MKHAYLFLLLCLLFGKPSSSRAQAWQDASNHYTLVIDSLMQHMDRTTRKVPTGILYDRVMPLARLHSFQSGPLADTASAAFFHQAYLELYTASIPYAPMGLRTVIPYDPDNPGYPPIGPDNPNDPPIIPFPTIRPPTNGSNAFPVVPTAVRQQAERYRYRDSIAIGVLNYDINYLDFLAIEHGNVLFQNGLLYDVPNTFTLPYLTAEVMVAAALVDTVRGPVSFYLPPSLLLGKRRVTSISVDFQNGAGPVTFSPGQGRYIVFRQNGPKVLTYTVNFQTGPSIQCKSSVFVNYYGASHRSSMPTRLYTIDALETFGGYQNEEALYGRGQVLDILHNTQSQNEYSATPSNYKLRNPVIIMDGFDALDRSGLTNIFDKESLYQVIQNAGILGAAGEQERDVILLNFPNSPRKRANGTITDYNVDGGADYIERNALVLVALIQQLKPRLASSNEKFVIIGPSMGGLISRYALAYMEKKQLETGLASWNHNTSLWVSLDAPHQGANVPIGTQEFLHYFQNMNSAAKDKLNNLLGSAAAKQMLVHHYLWGSKHTRWRSKFS